MARWGREPKIDPKEYFSVSDTISNKAGPFTVTKIAEYVGASQNSVWQKLFKNGLTSDEARDVADAIEGWGVKIAQMVHTLRSAADKLDNGELEPFTGSYTSEEVKRPVRSRDRVAERASAAEDDAEDRAEASAEADVADAAENGASPVARQPVTQFLGNAGTRGYLGKSR